MKQIRRIKPLNHFVQNKVVILFCSLVFILTFYIAICGALYTQAAPTETTFKYYTSIQIKAGDTLWDIAKQYITEDYTSMNEYINEVCAINHITKDNIHAGQYIVVPYYAAETIDSSIK